MNNEWNRKEEEKRNFYNLKVISIFKNLLSKRNDLKNQISFILALKNTLF